MATTTTTNNNNNKNNNNLPMTVGIALFSLYVIYHILYWAWKIRMQAIEEYGLVIHEFDPYFNYRATEYLYEHGASKFFTWFDYMVWYPLGRPVGTTIYPGMQFTAVYLKQFVLNDMSINNICCMIPAWFGSLATFVTGLLAYECALPENANLTPFDIIVDLVQHRKPSTPPASSSSPKEASSSSSSSSSSLLLIRSPALECALVTMAIMSVIPAHLMRSIGGGYDNESVAMTAMTLTFYAWVRALRGSNSRVTTVVWGILSGLAYFYMVAAWGGYIFVLNMVGVHALLLVLMGRFTTQIYTAYSLFYVIGTSLAIQIPVVGWAPLKSLEQLGPCLIFLGYQGLQFTEVIRKKNKWNRWDTWKFRVVVATVGLFLLGLVVSYVAPSGYFGPLSSRVRGLFVRHTKTGNPLVDSVAEHQPASQKAYFQYLHHICLVAPLGYMVTLFHMGDASSFLLGWGAVTYFFSSKMVRLVLLLAPISSILAGMAIGRLLRWCLVQLWDASTSDGDETHNNNNNNTDTPATKGKKTKQQKTKKQIAVAKPTKRGKGGKNKKGSKNNLQKEEEEEDYDDILESAEFIITDKQQYNPNNPFTPIQKAMDPIWNSTEGILLKRTCAVMFLLVGYFMAHSFVDYSWRLSKELSHPSIIVPARTRQGQIIRVDDYREAYWWLRDNTPADARILAWWDYGYQITAIANRTTIADGNTWNHEHIALLGKCLTASLQEGYDIARHLADYVLIWAGGGGDDLAKSPHLARIANSVYRDHCPKGDTTCRAFGFLDRQGTASPMMERSLLYQLHGHALRPGVKVSDQLFVPVYQSKYGKVRIYKIQNVDQESKAWVANPNHRVCDVPGSWFCPGRYPPGLSDILSKSTAFAQLEDFNRAGGEDKQYQKDYFDALNDPHKARDRALQRERAAARLKEKHMSSSSSSSSNYNAAANNNNNNKASSQQQQQRPSVVARETSNVVINPDGSVTQEESSSSSSSSGSSSGSSSSNDRNNDDDHAHIPNTPDPASMEAVYNDWRDTETTTNLWNLISQNSVQELSEWLAMEPLVAFSRSKDGRGPMWWAYENKKKRSSSGSSNNNGGGGEIIALLKSLGVPDTDVDAGGQTPREI